MFLTISGYQVNIKIVIVNHGRWADALRQILEISDIRAASVAGETGLSRAAISYFIAGERQPAEETAQSINAALGKLLHEPNVASYLDTLYWADRAEDTKSTSWPTNAWEIFQESMDIVMRYLRREEAAGPITRFLEALPPRRLAKLILAINEVRWRHLSRHILGDADPSKTHFDSVFAVCQKHGLDLQKWMRPPDEIAEQLDEDELHRGVREALREISEPSKRFEIERRIDSAFDRFRLAQLRRERNELADHLVQKTQPKGYPQR
ncbi:MAG: helix-turn-helix transcriptional regulator [Candidatus Cybelea sp.]